MNVFMNEAVSPITRIREQSQLEMRIAKKLVEVCPAMPAMIALATAEQLTRSKG